MSDTIKIGAIADQTGALSIMGAGQANVATLVVDEMNASGGVLGRDVELIIKDSATDDEQAAAAAAKLVQDDHVDVLLGGIFSSTRQAIKQPAVVEGETLYIYPGPPQRSGRSSASSGSLPRESSRSLSHEDGLRTPLSSCLRRSGSLQYRPAGRSALPSGYCSYADRLSGLRAASERRRYASHSDGAVA